MKKLLALLFLFLFSVSSLAQSPTVQPATASNPDTDKTDLRKKTFEQVWNTINEKHYDTTFGGVDWQAVKAKYEPRVTQVKTDSELFSLLQQMLGELKQSHFHIIPLESYVENQTQKKDENKDAVFGVVGIELRMIDGKAVITKVNQDSPAFNAGLRSGFLLEAVGNEEVPQIITRIKKAFEQRNFSSVESDFILAKLLTNQLNGLADTTVNLRVSDEKNNPRTVTLKRTPDMREMSPALGYFLPQPMEFEAKRLTNNIGYIRFNIWVMPQMEKIRNAIKEMKDTKRIIFDLRDNPGGIGGMAAGVSGMIAQEEGSLGKMQMRSGFMSFPVFPQAQSYSGEVVILTDFGSASTSEIFAAGLQEMKRATVVGERTHGAALPSFFERLPLPAIFQYAIADYRTPKGVLVEGQGVKPDIEIKLNRADLLSGRDTQLETAINLIIKTKKN